MRPRWLLGGMLLLTLASPVSAVQLWATWELELEGHAPPQHFVLSVTSPTGMPVPPPMTVPWVRCTSVPDAQHCAPIGCPPMGLYTFEVRAQYAEGLSEPSNTWHCTIVTSQCTCPTAPVPLPRLPVPPAPRPTTRPVPPPGLPPLVPVGAIPPLPSIPPIPTSGGA
jgi:hypothetical protein